jgi:hypothetical protein
LPPRDSRGPRAVHLETVLADWRLYSILVFLMLALLALCRLAARGIGMRLEGRAAAAGFVLPLLVLSPWLLSTRLLAPVQVLSGTYPGAPVAPGLGRHAGLSDVVYQLLPWELEVRHALRAGRLPLWSDRLEGGSSPWVNPQAGALSPVAWLTRALPIQHHLLAALAFKMMIAFYGAWLLARRLGRSRAAAALAAAGFCLGGGIMAWGLFPAATTLAWVPWVCAGAIGLCRRPRPAAIAATATLTAALLLSGHPETAAAGGCLAVVCGLCFRRRGGPSRAWRGPAAAALAAALGFGLAAPQMVPFLASLPAAQRTREMRLALSPAAAPGVPIATAHGLWPPAGGWFAPDLRAFLLAPAGPSVYGIPYEPPFRGPWDWPDALSGYAGVVALAGAVLAMGAARDRRAWPFLTLAALCLLLAAGCSPLRRLGEAVPVLRLMAWPRLLMLTSLGLAIGGSFGVDHLLGRRRGAGEPRGTSAAPLPPSSATPPASAEPTAWDADPARQRRRGGPLATAAALAVAAAAGLTADHDAWSVVLWAGVGASAALAWRRPRWGAVALGAVLAGDLGVWSQHLLPREDPALFYPRTPFIARLAAAAGDPARWRAMGGDYLVYPSLLPVHGIAEVRPNGPLAPASYLRVLGAAFGFRPTMSNYYARLPNLDHPLLDFLGVRAVVSSVALPPSRRLLGIDGDRWLPFHLLHNPHALPRWFFPTAVQAVERGRRGALERWIAGMAPDQDPRRIAVWRDEAAGWLPAAWRDPLGVRAAALAPGRVLLDLAPGGETLLATSLPVAGWHAAARGRGLPAGRELRTLTINGAFLGVRIPASVLRVELAYTPPGLRAGVWCCAGALAVLAGGGMRGIRRARAAGSTGSSAPRSSIVSAASSKS